VTHIALVDAHRNGRITVEFDAPATARLLSAKLMLPLFTLPVLGLEWPLRCSAGCGAVWASSRWPHRAAPDQTPRGASSADAVLSDSSLYHEVCAARCMRISPRAET
jgi:hypothetical protein